MGLGLYAKGSLAAREGTLPPRCPARPLRRLQADETMIGYGLRPQMSNSRHRWSAAGKYELMRGRGALMRIGK
jgi:hypothetical protein